MIQEKEYQLYYVFTRQMFNMKKGKVQDTKAPTHRLPFQPFEKTVLPKMTLQKEKYMQQEGRGLYLNANTLCKIQKTLVTRKCWSVESPRDDGLHTITVGGIIEFYLDVYIIIIEPASR